MSAMRAEELPELPDWLELPAAMPPDSAHHRAATRWAAPQAPAAPAQASTAPPQALTAPAQAPASPIQAPAAPVPGPTPRHDAPGKQAILPARAARGRAANPPLRLTRRGRIVVAIAAALVLAALSLVIAGAAQATNHPVSARTAQQNLAQVIVHPGQSLWSVAESADPSADTRVIIQQIIELNSLTGNTVFAGQRLWVPRA
jgi:hypothetical protein